MISIGQRWLNHNDAELGLGIVQDTSGRRVEVYFPAIDETRHYAIDNAPLTRYQAQVGQSITTIDDLTITITDVVDDDGMLFYLGLDDNDNKHRISEVELGQQLRLNSPAERLLNGQIEHPRAYALRYRTLVNQADLAASPIRGLRGARVDLLAHQLYIAHEVASRRAPRVLLADEVGLGKTIEAGMIIHQQLYTGRAQRVLILVPDSLVHQWLVELLRRFNLHFALFDAERCAQFAAQTDEQGKVINPFETEQQIICSLDALLGSPDMQIMAKLAEWDLLIVDEAHHLHWSENQVGDDYQLVEAISKQAEGLLLLTATPQQAGVESHFARLRLLDPNRFHSFQAFLNENDNAMVDPDIIDRLLSSEQLKHQDLEKTIPKDLFNEFDDPLSNRQQQQLLDKLIDQHGMGRILFRNTRQALASFPQRVLQEYPLEQPDVYKGLSEASAVNLKLFPESDNETWVTDDPRIDWLYQLQRQLSDQKILVIAHRQQTALALYNNFKNKLGISCSCFHEGMTLIERDRAAAYFSDKQEGAKILFCSEIGSEGRNFQFASHLVMFDLPSNPDLIEQRIGRLDRIGQQGDVNIHIPFIKEMASEVLFNIYQKGFNLFLNSFSSAFVVYEHFLEKIQSAINAPKKNSSDLIDSIKHHANSIRQQQEQGRDRLLELNSCRQPQASDLVEQLSDLNDQEKLVRYFESILDEYGVDFEQHSSSTWVLRPSGHMKHSFFPGLKEEGNTLTVDRYKALVREDIEYLTWEHPMVADTMEMVLQDHIGAATLSTISVKGLAPGTLLLETVFQLQASAPKYLQLDRYISKRPIRVLIDRAGKNLSKVVSFEALEKMSQPVKTHISRQIIAEVRNTVEPMVESCKKEAELQRDELIQNAKISLNELLIDERTRLKELQKRNPNIRPEEISALDTEIKMVEQAISKADLVLQGIKLVVVS